MRQRLEFWYDFASTYSYLSAVRIEQACKARNINLVWRPFLLGPIFKEQNWRNSPFVIYPLKGSYMWRDVQRRAARYGRSFCRPKKFPQHSLGAARIAVAIADAAICDLFTRAVFQAQFEAGIDIGDSNELKAIAARCGVSQETITASTAPNNKARLRSYVNQAKGYGIFGAPSFVVNGELFWGDDRLEDAMDYAIK